MLYFLVYFNCFSKSSRSYNEDLFSSTKKEMTLLKKTAK